MNILYEDASIVVLEKPAGLSSEEGVPAALRQAGFRGIAITLS